jgi:hypothetical protein
LRSTSKPPHPASSLRPEADLSPHAGRGKKELARVLLAPKSVAIVGQSNDAAKTAGRPLKYLRQAGYAGRIYPIARRDEVLGERAWPSLAALPEVPEHAYIVTGTDAAIGGGGGMRQSRRAGGHRAGQRLRRSGRDRRRP